jgi:hypothetical protein
MKTTPLRTMLHRPWAVWLAVLIAVLGALAPTVSHALMPAMGQAPQGVEICTSEGPRWVATDTLSQAEESSPTRESAATLDHCPFCLQTTDRVASIDDPLPYLFLVPDGQREPTVWQAFFYPATHTFTPPPRGPPGRL